MLLTAAKPTGLVEPLKTLEVVLNLRNELSHFSETNAEVVLNLRNELSHFSETNAEVVLNLRNQLSHFSETNAQFLSSRLFGGCSGLRGQEITPCHFPDYLPQVY